MKTGGTIAHGRAEGKWEGEVSILREQRAPRIGDKRLKSLLLGASERFRLFGSLRGCEAG